MKTLHKVVAFVAMFCIVISCTPSPKIPITENLSDALKVWNVYDEYVRTLNKAVDKDTSALHQFLMIDYVSDSPGYDHGDILVHLMQKYSDAEFATALNKLGTTRRKELNGSFSVGFEYGTESDTTIFSRYKQSLQSVGLTEDEVKSLMKDF